MNTKNILEFLNQFQGKFVNENESFCNSKFDLQTHFHFYNDGLRIENVIQTDNPHKNIKKDIYEIWINPDTRFDCTLFRLHLRWWLLSNNETWDEIIQNFPNINIFEYPFKPTKIESEKDFPNNKIVEAYWICEEARKKTVEYDIPENPGLHAIFIPNLGWVFLNKKGISIGTIDDVKLSIKNFCESNKIWENEYTIDFIHDEVVIWE